MLPAIWTSLLVPLARFLSRGTSNQIVDDANSRTGRSAIPPSHLEQPLRFELRHLHAVSPSSQVLFSDVQKQSRSGKTSNVVVTKSDVPRAESSTSHLDGAHAPSASLYSVPTRKVKSFQPPSIDAVMQAHRHSLRFGQNQWLGWEEEEVVGPDVESREALLELAKMTNNAYVAPDDPDWYDLDGKWNNSYPFGWEPESDGFRGHVFATPDNKTVVLSIKGTSAGFLGGGGPTAKKDKLNDNLLFSCCCAHVGFSWTEVCKCYRQGWKCDINCLEQALTEDSLFFPLGTNLYSNVTYMYPDSNLWIIGHSLGGALAGLLGATFGRPVVTFEAPGEKMAASRLHLPLAPSTNHITHIYHTADPIAMGTCNGVLSSCAIGGYAMESRCHLGKTIVYDTISTLGWSEDIRTHGIVNVIEKVLKEPWRPSEEVGRQVPEAVIQEDCVECFSWEFGNFTNG